MKIIRTIEEMQQTSQAWKREGRKVGMVPTMGFLHAGHLSLVHAAKKVADVCVVSIFVNPTQFGPAEDLARYPRDFERDCQLCREAGVDAVFAPEPAEMYAPDYSTWVVEERLSGPLCGEKRPGHFRGVTSVVAKLFNAALPDVAVFGQKDAQQALVLQRMVRDLNFPVKMVVAPIVREADGLAMSSRNVYLSPDERARALSISQGLNRATAAFAGGVRDAAALCADLRAGIEAAGGRVDYVEIRSRNTLAPLAVVAEPALMAVAAFFGKTRLIDNIFLG
jgi:pantoate--beta-alanine ligase